MSGAVGNSAFANWMKRRFRRGQGTRFRGYRKVSAAADILGGDGNAFDEAVESETFRNRGERWQLFF